MSSLAKVNSVLEKFWWAMTVVTLIMVLIFCLTEGFSSWVYYFAVPILTALMALMRRLLRKRLEKSEAERDQREGKSK